MPTAMGNVHAIKKLWDSLLSTNLTMGSTVFIVIVCLNALLSSFIRWEGVCEELVDFGDPDFKDCAMTFQDGLVGQTVMPFNVSPHFGVPPYTGSAPMLHYHLAIPPPLALTHTHTHTHTHTLNHHSPLSMCMEPYYCIFGLSFIGSVLHITEVLLCHSGREGDFRRSNPHGILSIFILWLSSSIPEN